jgi:hypothetical protein
MIKAKAFPGLSTWDKGYYRLFRKDNTAAGRCQTWHTPKFLAGLKKTAFQTLNLEPET